MQRPEDIPALIHTNSSKREEIFQEQVTTAANNSFERNGQDGYSPGYSEYKGQTPYTETPITWAKYGTEQFIEMAGHLEHSRGAMMDVTPKPHKDAEQRNLAAANIDQEYQRLLKEAMKDTPTKKVWRSSGVNLTQLKRVIAEPYKVIMECAATDYFDSWSQLKKDICSYYGMAMYSYSVKHPPYMTLITAMRSLYWTAQDGGEVLIETDLISYDYSQVFLGLDAISGKSISKNKITWKTLVLYPSVNFPIDVKDNVIFQPLNILHPHFMKLVKKHKLMLYVTSDYNLAIGRDFLDIDELNSHLAPYWNNAHYQFPNDLKLYIIE